MRVKDGKEKSDGLAFLGKICIGEMRKSEKTGKPYPVSLDYFKATGDNGPVFHNLYGPKPTTIRIMFISENDDYSCNEILEYRKGSTLYADGDGEIFRVWDSNNDMYAKFSCEEYKEKYGKDFVKAIEKKYPEGKWQRVLKTKFFIFEPCAEGEEERGLGNVWGYWRFDTKGEKTSLRIIRDAFDAAKERSKGKILGTMFLMSVKMAQSTNPGQKKVYPVVTLTPEYNEQQKQLLSNQILQLEAPNEN